MDITNMNGKFCKNGVYCFLTLQSINKSYSIDILNMVTSFFSTEQEDVEAKLKETKIEDEQKEEGFLDKVKKYATMFTEFQKNPISFLNSKVYYKYECSCEKYPILYKYKCQTDNKTGIHYKQFGNNKSRKYLFFFHGMLYDIDYFWKIENNSDECDYNLVFVEYNSFKKDNEEVTYGFTQIKEMSDLIYKFICDFLEDKNPEKVILCGHSHGNNYPIELLDKFITNNKYVDKLSYLGIKGYFRIEKALLHALEALRNGDYSIFINFLLPKKPGGIETTDEEKLDIIRNMVGKENYYSLKDNNNNEVKMQKIIDKVEISNTKLTGKKHAITLEDLQEVFEKYNSYKKVDSNKIPCLLFYSDEDEYVGDEFKIKIEKLSKEQLDKKEQEKQEEIKNNDVKDKKIQEELDKIFKQKNIKKEEVYKKPTGVIRAVENEIAQKPKQDQYQKQDQDHKKDQVPQTTDKKTCCEKCKK